MSYTETLADGTVFGNVPGIQPGTYFRSRRELHDKKLHKGLMNGIATRGSSIVLSGGYVDDEDLGDVISIPEKVGAISVPGGRLQISN